MRFFSTMAAAAAFAGFVNADAYVAAAVLLSKSQPSKMGRNLASWVLPLRAHPKRTKWGGIRRGPTKAGMYVYVPTKKVDKAPIIVAIHYCTGTAQKYFSGSNCASLADTHGFIVICPNSPSSGGCWDVASTSSLTHGKGGDSETIVNMVKYAVTNYGGDADRVFATGSSPGAMMTNVLAGAYPDVFKAGSVYSGVPDACFYVSGATTRMATPDWSNSCANGQNIKTTQAWGNLVRSYYPGYNGAYPKMQI